MSEGENEVQNTESAEAVEVAETAQTEPIEAAKVEPAALSNRDALAKAFEDKRIEQGIKPAQESSEQPTAKEVKAAVTADPEPPSEFSAAGKKAWKDKDIAGIQREYKRIHDARTVEISRAQQREREALEKTKPWARIAEMAEPYIKAQGDLGVTPEQAIMNALALVNSMKTEKPSAIKAELKKIGIDLDKGETGESAGNDKVETLQATVNALLEERQQAQMQTVRGVFADAVSKLASQKTRTGQPVFPDLFDNSEAGERLAAEVGSLVTDPRFQQGVARRFPDADYSVLVREAYKYSGGRIEGEPVSVSTQNQKQHLDKARRAAASTPGRASVRSEAQNLGKLGNKAALAKALEELRER